MAAATGLTPTSGEGLSTLPGLIWHLDDEPGRRLRGDWEAPDFVVVGYHRDWSDAAAIIAATTSPFADVLVLGGEDHTVQELERWIEDHSLPRARVRALHSDVDTGWVRDYGPLETRLLAGGTVWLNPRYDFTRPRDDEFPHTLGWLFDSTMEAVPERLDGGAIVSNGEGFCVSTVDAFDKFGIVVAHEEWIEVLMEQLGCTTLALVPALVNDPTKHADMFAMFTAPHRLALAWPASGRSPQDGARMEAAATIISSAAEMAGLPLHIEKVPLWISNDRQLYYPHLNGLRVGDTYLVPVYAQVPARQEAAALRAIARAMPGVRLIPVPADNLIGLYGAVHCITLGLADPDGARPRATEDHPRRSLRRM